MMMSVLRTVLLLILAADFAEAQTFHGPYAGVDLARQHVIGGSLVDGIDTLQEDSRLVVSVFGGARAQIARVVFGGELGLGFTNGELSLTDLLRSLTVDYRNGSQWGHALFRGNVISAEMQAEMRALVPAAGNIPGESGAGLGIRAYQYLHRSQYGHSGGATTGSSLLMHDPETGVTVAVIMNQGQGAEHFVLAPRLLEIATAR